jgi:hypothetical protein
MKGRDVLAAFTTIVLVLLVFSPNATAQQTFQCAYEDSVVLESAHVDTAVFFPYIPGSTQSLENRDLEFQWSAHYSGDLPSSTTRALDHFGGVPPVSWTVNICGIAGLADDGLSRLSTPDL